MIVPQARLLFWWTLIVLPFSALGAVYPAASLVSLALVLGLVGIALVDAGLASGRLGGLSVELPPLVRMAKDRPTVLPVILKNEHRRSLQVRVGLALPRELQAPYEDQQVLLPAETDRAQLEWRCHPVGRGRLLLKTAYLETLSPLRLWAVRKTVPAPCEARVYPNLERERKNLAALFLNRGAFGLHAQRQVGKGRDFEKLREYTPGDSYDEIHWKATARRGHPITKVFQIERTQEVYVIIDASRLSARRVPAVPQGKPTLAKPGAELNAGALSKSSPETVLVKNVAGANAALATLEPPEAPQILERFITASLILGQAAEQQGDLFGLMSFADQVQTFLRARNGKEHYCRCRDAIYLLEPRPTTPDFDEIAATIRTRLRRRALLIFLTSLDDPLLAEGFVRNASLLAGQHLVLVNMIRPPGASPLFSKPDVENVDDLYRHLGGHLRWHNLRELEKVLQRRGVRFALLENEKLTTELVAQYLAVKQRQLL